jgi:hypothetical protein
MNNVYCFKNTTEISGKLHTYIHTNMNKYYDICIIDALSLSDDILSNIVSYKIYLHSSDWSKKKAMQLVPDGYVIVT